jgi:tetratricopeptide (TPR) repeat protein
MEKEGARNGTDDHRGPRRQVDMPPGKLIAFRNDRLGARLLSLVNAQRLAQDHGLEFVMRWIEGSGVGAEFNDPYAFFDPAFIDRYFIDAATWQALRGEATKLNGPATLTSAELKAAVAAGRNFTVELAFGCVVLADEDERAVADKCAALFRDLPLAPKLAALSERIDTAFRSATAYHIRRGDIISTLRAKNRSWPKKYVPVEFYIEHLGRERDAGHNVILFSDDPELIANLKTEYPGCQLLSDTIDYAALSQGEIDFLELLALTKCGKIIAPEGSAFSSTAAQLGEVPRISLKDDLEPDGHAAACEMLRTRLLGETPTPETAGELAQGLLHVDMHMADGDARKELATIYRKVIEAGLDISFVYPRAADLLIEAGDLETVARFAAEARPYHDKDLVQLRLREAAALAGLGRLAGARRALQSVLALDPTSAELSRVLPRLIILGGLTEESFLPASADVLGLAGRAQSSSKGQAAGLAHLEALLPAAARQAEVKRGALEPLLWDWDVLFNAGRKAAQSLSSGFSGKILRSLDLKAQKDGGLGAQLAGVKAMTVAHAGEPRRAIDLLGRVVAAAPEDALSRQRLSHAHWLDRDWSGAAEHAVQAVQLKEAPAYHAWAGICLEKRSDLDRAHDHLLAAHRADTGFPAVATALSRVAARRGDPDAALEALDTALALDPNNARLEVSSAELMREAGDVEGAIAALQRLAARGRMPIVGYRTLSAFLSQAGRPEAARDAARLGLQQKPEDRHLRHQLDELGG